MTHTISSWLAANQNGELKMRGWFLERAIDDCHTKGEYNLDPTTTNWLTTGPLANLWEFAWQVYFKGNETAAWASLERHVAGRSRRFIVTLCSGKYDGQLMVVTDVGDEAAAFTKVAELWSEDVRETWVYHRLQHEEGVADLLLPEGFNEDDIRDTYESEGGPYRFFEMYAAQLKFNRNLPGVVAW